MILVEIENFQSISKTSLQIDGFTAVVGRSNIGKSAIVRALKCALTGSSGSSFVRHDPQTCGRLLRKTKKCKCFSSVKMTFDEGPVLLWEKGDTVNRYTVWNDGVEKVYDRVGASSDLPDFVETKFAPVKLSSSTDGILQVSDQFDPIFLLNLKGTVVADVLSDLGQLEAINKAMSLVSRDKNSANATRRVREKDLSETTAKLAGYDGLDDTLNDVKRLQKTCSEAQRKEARRDLVVRLYDGARLALQEGRRLKKAVTPELPDLPVLEKAQARWGQVLRFSDGLSNQRAACSELEGVSDIVLPDASDLIRKLEILAQYDSWLHQLRAIKVTFQKSQSLREGFQALRETSPKELEDRSLRLQLITRFERLQTDLVTQTAHLENELEGVEEEEASVLRAFDELGACPSCHQPISSKHLHG